MKISIKGFFAKRKIIFIFLIAILLPSLFVGYLSFQTLTSKRDAIKKALESNLWVSGTAAIKSTEDSLFRLEDDILDPKRFDRFSQSINSSRWLSEYFGTAELMGGKYFLLDSRLRIIFPKTIGRTELDYFSNGSSTESSFDKAFRRAEQLEFSQGNYSRAAQLYRQCVSSAPSKQQKLFALEGQGRCLLFQNKYTEAGKIYSEIYEKFSKFHNRAGHPYGIVAALQIYEIERNRQQEEKGLKILLGAYEKAKKGFWIFNLATYDFFILEIESILGRRTKDGSFPDIKKSFQELQREKDLHSEALVFVDFLHQNVVPELDRKVRLLRQGNNSFQDRFSAVQGENIHFISFCRLPAFDGKETFLGGFCWDMDSLREKKIPAMLKDITRDSKLEFQITDAGTSNSYLTQNEDISKNFISLSFQQFPLPWMIHITQPALSDLEHAARRENLIYAILLAVIVVLMIMGAVLLARDVSRESEVSNLKTEFVRNISHELRTPLTLIRLYGETLQRKSDLSNEDKLEAYEIITKESERLSHLINNVLDFSRIETGRKEFDFKEGNMSQVIQKTIDSYRYHLEKNGFSIKEDIADDLPQMTFDREAISSVLINLLSNAIKFSKENKVVSIKFYQDGSNAVLQVQDKGIGIPVQDVPKIFDRFYRVKDSFVSETKGSGLGLPLVKHIIEAHKGSIRVESDLGKGSLFTIVLPLSKPDKDEG
jgi:signal transduction histidine kinase